MGDSNPEKAIVSIWAKPSNNVNEQFIGTAFFISPSLLLTAKHVVQDKQSNKLFNSLNLGLVEGEDSVVFNERHVFLHDRLDIALIRLDDLRKNLAFCRLDFNSDDYCSSDVDVFGIDKGGVEGGIRRDKVKRINVGKRAGDVAGYTIPHSVKEGFSGGAVTLHSKPNVIGIVLQRNSNKEQETLFLPLYQCKEWLEELNQKVKDQYLAGYLNPNTVATNTKQTYDQINKSVLALAKFIDRPKEAHHDIIKHFEQDRVVKTCLCLFASSDDKPIEFADTLGTRIGAGLIKKIDLDLLNNLDGFDRKILVPNPWDYEQKEDFISDCLIKIGENLGLKNHEMVGEQLLEDIFKVLNNAKKPKIMISDTSKKAVKANWMIFSKRKLLQKINERFAWVKEVDAQLEEMATGKNLQQGFKPMVLLFCLQVEAPILDKAKDSCHIMLTKITKANFFDWRGAVVNMFDKSNLHEQLEPLEKQFGIGLAYGQFLIHLKSSLSPRKQS